MSIFIPKHLFPSCNDLIAFPHWSSTSDASPLNVCAYIRKSTTYKLGRVKNQSEALYFEGAPRSASVEWYTILSRTVSGMVAGPFPSSTLPPGLPLGTYSLLSGEKEISKIGNEGTLSPGISAQQKFTHINMQTLANTMYAMLN